MAYRNQGARARAALAAVSGPLNTVAPAITGTTTVGSTLTCSSTWSRSPTISYQWNRNGSPISGAVAATRLLAAPDQGTKLTCTVTAVKAGVSISLTSPPTATIA